VRTYIVKAGTPAEVRKAGTLDWKPYTTARTQTFAKLAGTSPGAAFWMFEKDGWELRVRPVLVTRLDRTGEPVQVREATAPTPQQPKGDGYKPKHRWPGKGKGVSRNRAARTVKAWKIRGKR
jgi:hypothetical protein